MHCKNTDKLTSELKILLKYKYVRTIRKTSYFRSWKHEIFLQEKLLNKY